MAPLAAADQPRNQQPQTALEDQQPAQPVNSWLGPIEDSAADEAVYSTWDPSFVSPWDFPELLHSPGHIDTTVPELDGLRSFDVSVSSLTQFSCNKVVPTCSLAVSLTAVSAHPQQHLTAPVTATHDENTAFFDFDLVFSLPMASEDIGDSAHQRNAVGSLDAPPEALAPMRLRLETGSSHPSDQVPSPTEQTRTVPGDSTSPLVYPPDWTQYEDLNADPMLGTDLPELSDWVITGTTESQEREPRWGLLLSSGSAFESNTSAPASTGTLVSKPLSSGSASERINTPPASTSASKPLSSGSASEGIATPPASTSTSKSTSPPVVAAPSSAVPDVLRQRKPQRVRGKPTEEQRAKASLMRKVGNCLRCRAFKLAVGLSSGRISLKTRRLTHWSQCDPNTPCQQCQNVLGSARSYFEPCYRDRLDRVALARHGKKAPT